MRNKRIYGTVVILAWVWLSVLISEKLFPSDSVAEIVVLICITSLGVFISYSTEYIISKVRKKQSPEGENAKK